MARLCRTGARDALHNAQERLPHLRIQDYSKTVLNNDFVDKTPLIKEVFQHEYTLLTVPDLFGKSTNMDMMKKFFEIVVDPDGQSATNVEVKNGKLTEKPEQQLTENFKLFRNHNLSVYQDKTFYYDNCGQHPVVFVNFKTMHLPLGGVLDILRTATHEAFRQHAYLLTSEHLFTNDGGEFDRNKYEKYFDAGYANLTVPELKIGLQLLSKILHKRFNKPVLALVDDLDAPILEIILNYDPDYERTIDTVSGMISGLLNSADRAVIHSTTELAMILFKTPVNITHFSFLDNHKFATFYGYTENEVTALVNKLKVRDNLKALENWYGGYRILGTNEQIYNVWSIVNYLKEGYLQMYYCQSFGIRNIGKIMSNEYVQFMINDLLTGRVICIDAETKFNVGHVLTLRRIINSPKSKDDENEEKNGWLFIQFLYYLGYFNTIHVRLYDKAFCLEIPNTEVGLRLAVDFYDRAYFEKKFDINSAQITSFREALKGLGANASTFEAFAKSVARLFPGEKQPENDVEFYRVLFTLADDRTCFRLIHGELYGKDRFNHAMYVVRKDGTAVVMNVYRKSSLGSLEQIFSKNLDTAVKKHKTNYILRKIYVGIVLDKKTVSVSYLFNSTDVDRAVTLTS